MTNVGSAPSPEVAGAFKLAMRRLAATVTIISTGHGGRRYGMTATAVSSVTAQPPTLLICVNQGATLHEPMREAGRFCVNLLGAQHAGLVPVFSGKVGGEARFSFGQWSDGEGEPPFLADAQASLSCVIRQAVPYATHTIFIGEVARVRLSGDLAPLLYQDGALATAMVLDGQD